jgi:regulator of replication initiation timing
MADNNDLRQQIAHLRNLLNELNARNLQLQAENEQLRAGSSHSTQRPADDDWGEGPDPGRDQPATSADSDEPSSPIVQQQAEFFKIASEHKIDMTYLNKQGGTFIDHLAAIRDALRAHLLSTLTTMKSYYVFINYWSHMIRSGEVSFLFSFFVYLPKYSVKILILVRCV